MLPLLTPLDEVGESHVIYRALVNVVFVKRVGREERHVLLIYEEHRVRAQIRGNFLILALLNVGARCQDGVIVLERQLNRVVQRDFHGSLGCLGLRRGEWRESSDGHAHGKC